jgi:ABC-2 type transport system permease protein
MKKIFAISKNLLLKIWHDKRQLFLIFFVPCFVILVFGWSTGDIKNLKVFVSNRDEGVLDLRTGEKIFVSKEIIENLDKEILNLEEEDEEIAREKIKNKEGFGTIVFEKDFSKDLILKNEAKIKLILDATSPSISETIISQLRKSIEKTIKGKFAIEKELVFGKEEMRFIDFFAPGIIATTSAFIAFMLTIISFVKEKVSGVYERILASPISSFEIILGYLIAFSIINILQSAILLLTAIFAFNIYLKGSFSLALFLIFLNGLAFQSLAFLFSSFAKNEYQAAQFMPLVLIPLLLISGIFWPIESMPSFMQKISKFSPLTHSAEALRDVAIRGFELSQISKEIVFLFLFAFLFLILNSLFIMRRK